MVVYLVGVGPEPDLLTLRGATHIETADIIIYTALSNASEILRNATNPNVKIIDAGRQDKDNQRKIVYKNLEEGQNQKRIVRLFHGDPLSTIEGCSEAEYLASKQIPFEIVPGVSPLLTALSMAGIPPITEENVDFAVIRASEVSKGKPSFKRYPGFAAIASGEKTKEITQRLISDTKIPKNQKFAILRNHGTLNQAIEIVEARDLKDAAIWPQDLIVIGHNVVPATDSSWFEAKRASLKGQKIGYLWPGPRSGKIASFLESSGAEDISVPLVSAEPIEIRPPPLEKFDAIIFSNAEIISEFFNRVDVPEDKLFFAIGPEARHILEQRGITSAIPISHGFTPRGLASLILSTLPARGRLLIVSNSDFPETLRETLSNAHIVWEINLYNVAPVTTPPDLTACTAIIVGSTSVIDPLADHWGEVSDDQIVVSAGPTITRALFDKGLSPTLEAKDPSALGAIHSLTDHLYRNSVTESPASDS